MHLFWDGPKLVSTKGLLVRAGGLTVPVRSPMGWGEGGRVLLCGGWSGGRVKFRMTIHTT